MLAWRDLDDPEAGGSEVHASTVAQYWAEAGLEVTMRTSFAAGRPQMSWRDGYRVIRKAGRYMVFPRAAFSEMMGWHGGRDGLVEIWNGMPFFSPVWARTPHITFLHHIHGVMWDMTLPPRLARAGRLVESRLAPPLYHWTPIVTLSESSKHELLDELHFKSSRVTVVPPGIDPKFSPGDGPAADPLAVAVGRLVPVKRFDLLIDALVDAKSQVPRLRAVIVGEGYERESLEARIRDARADDWISLPGHVTDEELIDLYRSAWVIASASAREGWGMTLTEAAACATPAVATRIAGHLDAVVDHRTGLLTGERREDLAAALAQVFTDDDLRARLSRGAQEHAERYTWGATALGTLEVLAREAIRMRGRTSSR
ncbi:MAG: glycosyltransferase family 4 protein [Actinobacteria bacterium]|nr:glycosyltransferase family 4 protein [Actinomycetota bacterium]